jgi:DNA polymerase-3 subunit delta'
MNANAANALLKNLEEPSGHCVFILVTERPAFLMATIRSRCTKVTVALPAPAESLSWLARNQVADAERLLDEAGGRPLRVMEWLEQDLWAQRDKLHSELVKLLSTDYSFLDCSKALLSFDLEWLLAQLHDWLRRAIEFAVVPQRTGSDDALVSCLMAAPAARLFAVYDTILLKKKHLRSGSNPNQQLLLDEITMDLKEFCRN